MSNDEIEKKINKKGFKRKKKITIKKMMIKFVKKRRG